MGFFSLTGKGSVYVACGNRLGGNEVRFPRVGNERPRPRTSRATLGEKNKRQNRSFDVCRVGVVGAAGVWRWACVSVCERGPVALGLGCAHAPTLVALETMGVRRRAPSVFGLGVCVCAHARSL